MRSHGAFRIAFLVCEFLVLVRLAELCLSGPWQRAIEADPYFTAIFAAAHFALLIICIELLNRNHDKRLARVGLFTVFAVLSDIIVQRWPVHYYEM